MYTVLPTKKAASMAMLYEDITNTYTTNVTAESAVLISVPVRNVFILSLSFIRCIMSPMFLESKKDMGNCISLLRKSDTSDMLMRVVT